VSSIMQLLPVQSLFVTHKKLQRFCDQMQSPSCPFRRWSYLLAFRDKALAVSLAICLYKVEVGKK